ncbi:MAG: Lrp/AsnC family transcriptional regulator [Gammaproteobacteria bacterium]|nr:Lrp/AsnC family transcriptional regulator [Gammaproteobacteria bacterium]
MRNRRQTGSTTCSAASRISSGYTRNNFDPEALGDSATPGPTPLRNVKLDRTDLKILAELQRNGRITNINLANAVSLSPSPCLLRVKRLEEAGYITSYNAHIDIAKLGETITVFTEVTLHDHKREDFLKFEQSIRTIDEVIECHLISGGYDYLLKFLTRGVAHYQAVIEGILERDIGVAKYFSYIVIKTPFQKLHYPLAKLFGEDQR